MFAPKFPQSVASVQRNYRLLRCLDQPLGRLELGRHIALWECLLASSTNDQQPFRQLVHWLSAAVLWWQLGGRQVVAPHADCARQRFNNPGLLGIGGRKRPRSCWIVGFWVDDSEVFHGTLMERFHHWVGKVLITDGRYVVLLAVPPAINHHYPSYYPLLSTLVIIIAYPTTITSNHNYSYHHGL